MSVEEYILITVAKQNFTWEGRILSRGLPYLPVRVSLPIRQKGTTRVQVGDVCMCNMHDADSGVGTADIIELLEPKEVRKLRHKKLIPEEEEYAFLLISDKKLGYTGGAFPYKAKISGMGASTMPEDPDVIARAKAEERAARRAARKAENNGVSPAMSASTTPAASPAVAPAVAEGGEAMPEMNLAEPATIAHEAAKARETGAPCAAEGTATPSFSGAPSPMAPLPSATSNAAPTTSTVVADSPTDGEQSDEECDYEENENEEGEENEEEALDLEKVVNPNHAKWSAHDGGVSKGYVSKRERRDLALVVRLKKRTEPAPRQSPSLIPQMAALDRVGGDADLEDI